MDFAITLFSIANVQSPIFETIMNVTIKVLLVIAGINALIIVHEFGHFIVARLCGVRCEKFYIWFDFWGLRFFKFKWGDTEYGLGVFPFGGYVKMLGQEDNPGELKAELERAKMSNYSNAQGNNKSESPQSSEINVQINTNDTDKPVHVTINTNTSSSTETRSAEDLQEAVFAPDSYLSKSVPQRLAIIVAGVVMNFIFAVVCAAAAYLVGVIDTAPIVGSVVPGSPAWEAGLQTDDKIKSINGNTIRAFMDVSMAALSGTSGVDVVIERIVDGEPQTITKKYTPRKRPNDIAPTIGFTPCIKLNLAEVQNYPVSSSARKFYSKETLDKLKGGNLHLAFIGDSVITGYRDYLDASLASWGQPVEMTFDRSHLSGNDKNSEQVKVVIPPIPTREVGLRFKMGAIASVHPDSDAAKKGIRKGDTIVAVDDIEDFDPLKLSYIILRKVNAGQKTVKLKIKKNNNSINPTGTIETAQTKNSNTDSQDNKTNSTDVAEKVEEVSGVENVDGIFETIIVDLQPVRIIPQISILSMQEPLGSTALGLAWEVEPFVAGYLSGASEDAKKIPIGSRIISVKFINGIPLLSKNSFSYVERDGVVFHDVGDRVKLPYILDNMLQIALTKSDTLQDNVKSNVVDDNAKLSVQFEVAKPDGSNELFPVSIYDSPEYFRVDRGLSMSELKATVKTDSFGEALSLGFNKTVEYSLAVYITLKRFYDGTVSPRALGGPVLVVQSAYSFVSRGSGAYLLFLCIIGANLAVVNLLPMPPLDGGHVVFLLYEGIFRRPPSIVAQAILSWAGLFLILLLLLWVVALDFSIIPRF
ncbi:MAG: site-2 protease family protein [Planctomycetaceae bacterium]|jgi:regulator of sigma E protease|nr:site-2 protease family protein [Planctomycetaceae bacterium]